MGLEPTTTTLQVGRVTHCMVGGYGYLL